MNDKMKQYIPMKVFVIVMKYVMPALIVVMINIGYTNYKTSSTKGDYVVVDTDAISRQFLSVIIKANLPDESYKNLLIAYDRTLTEVINKVSLQNNVVILKKNTVLTELPNVTNDIQNITFKEMKLDEIIKQ